MPKLIFNSGATHFAELSIHVRDEVVLVLLLQREKVFSSLTYFEFLYLDLVVSLIFPRSHRVILTINMLYHYPFDKFTFSVIKLSILRKLGNSLTTLGPHAFDIRPKSLLEPSMRILAVTLKLTFI